MKVGVVESASQLNWVYFEILYCTGEERIWGEKT